MSKADISFLFTFGQLGWLSHWKPYAKNAKLVEVWHPNREIRFFPFSGWLNFAHSRRKQPPACTLRAS